MRPSLLVGLERAGFVVMHDLMVDFLGLEQLMMNSLTSDIVMRVSFLLEPISRLQQNRRVLSLLLPVVHDTALILLA